MRWNSIAAIALGTGIGLAAGPLAAAELRPLFAQAPAAQPYLPGVDDDVSSAAADLSYLVGRAAAYRLLTRSSRGAGWNHDPSPLAFFGLSRSEQWPKGVASQAWSADSGLLRFGAGDVDLALAFSHRREPARAGEAGDEPAVFGLAPMAGISLTSDWQLNAGYEYLETQSRADMDRDASRHAVAVDNLLFFADRRASLTLGYRFESESAAIDELDYLGHQFSSGARILLAESRLSPTLRLGYQFASRDYAHATGFGSQRDDERHTVWAGVSLRLPGAWEALLEYEHVDARSDFSSADFSDHTMIFSIKGRF